MSQDEHIVELTEAEQTLFEEFRRKPVGQHSPQLQKLVNRMRGASMEGKLVLFCTKPYREWVLARTHGRAKPIEIYWDKVFTDLDAAEVAIFQMRLAEEKGAAS